MKVLFVASGVRDGEISPIIKYQLASLKDQGISPIGQGINVGSALPDLAPKSDIRRHEDDVRHGPTADLSPF